MVDVPVARWRDAVAVARDPEALGCDFFDWLSAVDELDEGFGVVAHLWSTRHRHGLLLRTRIPREDPVVESVVDLFPGAAWHERETYEMFGITFVGHPDLRPLLLPPEFEGHPLRKEFVLAARVAKAWPGAKEPGESESGAAKRAPMRPPGVPDPNEWGPLKGQLPPEAPTRRAPARAPGERPVRPAGRAPGERPARTPRPASDAEPASGAPSASGAPPVPEAPPPSDAEPASEAPSASDAPPVPGAPPADGDGE